MIIMHLEVKHNARLTQYILVKEHEVQLVNIGSNSLPSHQIYSVVTTVALIPV